MNIMKIEKFKKNKDNTYSVIFIDNLTIKLYDDTIIKYNLLINKSFDDKKFDEIISFNDSLEAYYKSVKFINKRLRCEKEIVNYLDKLNFSKSIIKDTLSRLKTSGYLNDDLYISSYINDQMNLYLTGPYKIKKDLNLLSFNDEIIDKYLNKIEYPIWKSRVDKYINKKLKSNKYNNKKFIDKTSYELNNLGYNKELINECLSKIDIDEIDIIKKDYLKIKSKLSKKYNGSNLEYQLRNKLYQLGYKSSSINDVLNK